MRELLSNRLLPILLTQASISFSLIGFAVFAGHSAQTKLDDAALPRRVFRTAPSNHMIPCVIGVSLGLIIIAIDIVAFARVRTGFLAIPHLPTVISISGRLGSAFYEEIIFRFGLLPVLLFFLHRLFAKKSPNGLFVTANVFSSIIFCLSHLPMTSALTQLDRQVVFRTFSLNFPASFVFGYAFYRWNFPGALLAHGSCNLTIGLLTS